MLMFAAFQHLLDHVVLPSERSALLPSRMAPMALFGLVGVSVRQLQPAPAIGRSWPRPAHHRRTRCYCCSVAGAVMMPYSLWALVLQDIAWIWAGKRVIDVTNQSMIFKPRGWCTAG